MSTYFEKGAADTCSLLGIAKEAINWRGIGTGIKRILKECRNSGITSPEFVEDCQMVQFKVIFDRIR